MEKLQDYWIPRMTAAQIDREYNTNRLARMQNNAERYDVGKIMADAEAAGENRYRPENWSAPWRAIMTAAIAYNQQADGAVAQSAETEAAALMAQPTWTRETWKRLVELNYARFSADEATADGAYFNTSYTLTDKGQELLRRGNN